MIFFIRTPEIGCNASDINGLVVVVGVVALMKQTDELQKESKSALFPWRGSGYFY